MNTEKTTAMKAARHTSQRENSVPPAPVTPADVAVEPYINKREVARRLNRTVRCVDNMMRRGMLPYYKLGYRVAFRWSEIQNHLAQTCRVCR